jgi:predicted NBD/HSP70 family sugar kinase
MTEGRVATSEQASRAGVGAVALLDPEIVVLGGGMSQHGEPLLARGGPEGPAL